MQSKIRDILLKIEALNNDLKWEYERLSDKYGFFFQQKKVVFLEIFARSNKTKKIPLYQYLIPSKWRHVLYIIAIPFIYGMIIPTVLLDICITIFQRIAFWLYGIPFVKRADFIIFDRRFLDYLNPLEKLNCLYCSYVNGVFAYAVEIGARTERFWCPLKAAHKPRFSHGWYRDFADYGDPEEWREKMKYDEKMFVDSFGDKYSIR